MNNLLPLPSHRLVRLHAIEHKPPPQCKCFSVLPHYPCLIFQASDSQPGRLLLPQNPVDFLELFSGIENHQWFHQYGFENSHINFNCKGGFNRFLHRSSKLFVQILTIFLGCLKIQLCCTYFSTTA